MWWHSFKVIAGDTIRPKPFSWEEKEEIMQAKIKATNKKDAKAAKKAAAEDNEKAE